MAGPAFQRMDPAMNATQVKHPNLTMDADMVDETNNLPDSGPTRICTSITASSCSTTMKPTNSNNNNDNNDKIKGPVSSLAAPTCTSHASEAVTIKHLTFPSPGRYSFHVHANQRLVFHVGSPGAYAVKAFHTMVTDKKAFRIREMVTDASVEAKTVVEAKMSHKAEQARLVECEDRILFGNWVQSTTTSTTTTTTGGEKTGRARRVLFTSSSVLIHSFILFMGLFFMSIVIFLIRRVSRRKETIFIKKSCTKDLY